MSIDYVVASLPALSFGAPAPISWAKFAEMAGDDATPPAEWTDLETQLRNALAEARGGAKFKRPAGGCSVFWRNRIATAYAEKDVARRDELLDKVWWDAAGELTAPAAPLGRGALQTYAIRLKIALRRAAISKDRGNEAFDRLTAETRKGAW